MMDLHRLRLLRELEARGTMTRVADALAFTPSAVSQQLARLEQETGLTLLERIGRGVRLTDAGRLLAAHAERILAAVDTAEAELAAQAETVQGALRVGELALVCEDEYDTAALTEPSLDREDLLTDRLRLVLPREDPLAAAETVKLADLSDRPWASGRVDDAYSAAVERTCRERGGFAPRVLHRASDLMLLLSLVRVGRAVALLPDLLGADRDDSVAVRSIDGGDLSRTIYTVVRASSAHRPTVIALRRALAAVASGAREAPSAQGEDGASRTADRPSHLELSE
jgi:DNA-binding transcriptional LysR family regulator